MAARTQPPAVRSPAAGDWSRRLLAIASTRTVGTAETVSSKPRHAATAVLRKALAKRDILYFMQTFRLLETQYLYLHQVAASQFVNACTGLPVAKVQGKVTMRPTLIAA